MSTNNLNSTYYTPGSQTPSSAEETSTTPSPNSTAHGLPVQMTHPCSQQRCKCHVEDWKKQTGNYCCVFCMSMHTGGRRCPGCEALACKTCFEQIAVLERKRKMQFISCGA